METKNARGLDFQNTSIFTSPLPHVTRVTLGYSFNPSESQFTLKHENTALASQISNTL